MASFSGQTLKILEIKHCSNITLVGWQSLATALASLDNLEDVSIQFHLVNNEDDALLDSNSSLLLLNTFISEPFNR
jgi:NADH/NAD ratio-sensing transcriptional regulator Rex